MKSVIIGIIFIFLTAFSCTSLFAAEVISPKPTSLLLAASFQHTRIGNFIDTRVEDITTLKEEVAKDPLIEPSAKKTIVKELNTTQVDLSKIKQDVFKATESGVLNNYTKKLSDKNINGYVMRKIKLWIFLEHMQTYHTQFSTFGDNFQDVIKRFEKEDKDVERLQRTFDDLTVTLSAIELALKDHKVKLIKTTPEDYEKVFRAIRSDSVTIREQYVNARTDFVMMRRLVTNLKDKIPMVTPKVIPTKSSEE